MGKLSSSIVGGLSFVAITVVLYGMDGICNKCYSLFASLARLGDKDNCGIGGIFSQKSCSERGQSSSRTKVVRDDDIT